MAAHTLSIDIETYSGVNISKAGLYKYVQSRDFDILLFAYSFDDEPVEIIDLTEPGRRLPYRVMRALADPAYKKTAYNAAFEWYALNKFYRSPLEQWECTMVHGLYCGYPAGLGKCALAMGFAEDKQKDRQGAALIRKFCIPRTPTKNKPYTRTLPKHEPEQWELFKSYCKQDVVVEKAIKAKLDAYPMPETEQQYWVVDTISNSTGVSVDTGLISGAIAIDQEVTADLENQLRKLTGLANPNSDAQQKAWLEAETGVAVDSLNKSAVPGLIKQFTADGRTDAVQMLNLRGELKKTSIKKYYTMKTACCEDNRVRGLLQFYGAHTGRWAGRLIQVHNLPRNYLKSLDTARNLIKGRQMDALKLLYGNVPDTVSQCIRTAFIPASGNRFAIADYSAIEARVIAWLSGEQWRMEVFKTHGKIYEASASAMFGVPIERIVKGNPEYALRAKGKVAELALGYQGAKGSLVQMGALDMGLHEEELQEIVWMWRKSNPRICDLWYKVEAAAIKCVKTYQPQMINKGITFTRDEHYLFITLPSGRQLFYPNPSLTTNQWGKPAIQYEGQNQTTKKWETIETYGGRMVENMVQAIARDCLAEALYHLYQAGYAVRFHIHDEAVIEIPKTGAEQNYKAILDIMCRAPAWAENLPLNADGFVSPYYKKD